MNKVETWLGERMSVRRWLAVLCVVAVVATLIAYGAVAALRSDEVNLGGDDGGVPVGANVAGEQRPSSMYITANVGSFSDLDGRATVTLQVWPTKLPIEWTVTIRTMPTAGATGTASGIREIDLSDGECRTFAAALDEAVGHPDPDNDGTVGGSTIHAVSVGPNEYHFDLKNVGVIRLDADGMAELKQLLDKAEAQRAWLVPRTLPLRVSMPTPAGAAVAEVRPTANK
jgi:hypothetical protein